LGKFKTAYKQWHGYLVHFPKLTRHTLGARVDMIFTDCLALTLQAKYQTREQKPVTIEKLSTAFDLLKFFIQLLWEIGALEEKQFLLLSQHLIEIGKMIGGWQQSMLKKNSPDTMQGRQS